MYHCLLRHQIEGSLASDHISSRVTFYVTVKVWEDPQQRLRRFVQTIQYHLLLLLSISPKFLQYNLLFCVYFFSNTSALSSLTLLNFVFPYSAHICA